MFQAILNGIIIPMDSNVLLQVKDLNIKFNSNQVIKDLNFSVNKGDVLAIVGPNGSGKSNVAEAFRFVLGEQSIKSMRGKRGEDLIWNGAADSPRASRANVKMIFNNENKVFDIDFPEVTIERTVHRDGLNEYFINNSPVRLKDILEPLVITSSLKAKPIKFLVPILKTEKAWLRMHWG